MLHRIIRHVRGNAVGYVALFVALSGTAVAAGLRPGSVGTAQLKNRAVTGKKVALRTLTGANIRLRTLGAVPDSNRLGHIPASGYQLRVTGTCSGNRAISQIFAAGTVSCRPVTGGAITRVAAGTDLTGGGGSGTVTLSADENKVQHRVTGTCAASSAISSISRSGAVTCQTTNVTQLMGGSAGAVSSAAASFLAPSGLSAPNASETDVDALASAVQSTAGNLSVRVSAAPGGSAGWRFVLVVNGGSAAVQCSITASSTTCVDGTDRVAVPAGARVALEAIPSGTPTAGTRVMFGWTASS